MDFLGHVWNKSAEAVGGFVDGTKTVTGQVLSPIGDGLIWSGEKVNETSRALFGGRWDGPVRDQYHVGFFTIETRIAPRPNPAADQFRRQQEYQKQQQHPPSRAEVIGATQSDASGPSTPKHSVFVKIGSSSKGNHELDMQQQAKNNETELLERHRLIREKLKKEAMDEKKAQAKREREASGNGIAQHAC